MSASLTYEEIETKSTKKYFFSSEELKNLDPNNIPYHVAIVMDGNRRWATQKNLPPIAGHWKGVNALMDTVEGASDLGTKILTVYAFSTENWSRPQDEVNAIMELFELALNQQCERMVELGVALHTIGDLSTLSPSLSQTIKRCKQATIDCEKIKLVLAINYGGRNEICRAVKRITDDCHRGLLQKEDISEKVISKYLDTSAWPDPDLFIRTSGEHRLSNFLLWQVSYSEIFTSSILWPDFNPHELLNIFFDYQSRNRRLGG